jgi:hypothetical protein
MAHLSSGGKTTRRIPADYSRIPGVKKAAGDGNAAKKQWGNCFAGSSIDLEQTRKDMM